MKIILLLVSIFSFHWLDSGTSLYCGSVVYISPHLAVTAYHVAFGCKTLFVQGIGKARVIALDAAHDTALIETEGANNATVTINGSELQPKSRLEVIGYPNCGGKFIDFGYYLGYHTSVTYAPFTVSFIPGTDDAYATSINAIPGESGGGIFNDKHQLVAIMSGHGMNCSYVVPIKYLLRLVGESSIKSGNATAGAVRLIWMTR